MKERLAVAMLALLTLLALLGSSAPALSTLSQATLSQATVHHVNVVASSPHPLDFCAGGMPLPC